MPRAMVEVPERQGEQHHRADLWSWNSNEVTTPKLPPPPRTPRTGLVVFRRGPDNGSLSRDDLHRNEVVAAQTGLSAQPADTSRGEPSDTVWLMKPRNS